MLLMVAAAVLAAQDAHAQKFSGQTRVTKPPAPPKPPCTSMFCNVKPTSVGAIVGGVTAGIELVTGFIEFLKSIRAGNEVDCNSMTTCKNSCCVYPASGRPYCASKTAMSNGFESFVDIDCSAIWSLGSIRALALVTLTLLVLA